MRKLVFKGDAFLVDFNSYTLSDKGVMTTFGGNIKYLFDDVLRVLSNAGTVSGDRFFFEA